MMFRKPIPVEAVDAVLSMAPNLRALSFRFRDVDRAGAAVPGDPLFQLAVKACSNKPIEELTLDIDLDDVSAFIAAAAKLRHLHRVRLIVEGVPDKSMRAAAKSALPVLEFVDEVPGQHFVEL